VISDFDLIQRTLRGDQQAFASLVNRHKSFAYTVAVRVLNDEEEAEEAAMDAFVKAHRNLGKFQGDSKFTTWFYRIVTNEALTRKRKVKAALVDLDKAENQPWEEQRPDGQQAALVRAGIQELGEKDAMLLTLYYLEEQNLAEVGETLQMDANTVKVAVHRARKRLAEALYRQLGDEVKELLN
jgi:RNA polymerase sigma factor (sigma-70 family)